MPRRHKSGGLEGEQVHSASPEYLRGKLSPIPPDVVDWLEAMVDDYSVELGTLPVESLAQTTALATRVAFIRGQLYAVALLKNAFETQNRK